MLRSVSNIAHTLILEARRETGVIFGVLRARARHFGVRGFIVSLVVSVAVLVVYALDHFSAGHVIVTHCCDIRAEYPWWRELLGLPGSMVAPAPSLPVWGSVAQVALVFAVAEAALGRRQAIGVALLGHAVATMSARAFIWLGPTVWSGLGPGYAHVLDTGPSAATVALTAYLAVVLRTPIVGIAALAGLLSELWVRPDLAGREHVVALAVGVIAGALCLARQRRRNASMSADQPSPDPALV